MHFENIIKYIKSYTTAQLYINTRQISFYLANQVAKQQKARYTNVYRVHNGWYTEVVVEANRDEEQTE